MLWVRGLNSLFLWGYLVVLVPFVEKIILSPLNGTLIKKQLTINVRRVCFYTPVSVSLMYVSILVPIPHYLDNCSLVVSFKIRKCESSNLVLLFQDCFVYMSPECWHIKFRTSLSISKKKKAVVILLGIASHLKDNLRSIVSLTVLTLPIHKRRVSFYLFRPSWISFDNVL